MSIEMTAPAGPGPAGTALRSRQLARGFAVLTGVTTVLVTLGGLVRAHGAGLACPDWPLCFGEAIPTFDLKIGFEVGHRYLASLVSLGFAGLAVFALRAPGTRRIGAVWLTAGAVLLAAQIVLGALTVWELLARWTVTSHLLTGNAFNAVLACTAARFALAAEPAETRPAFSAAPGASGGALRALVTLSLLALVAQVALGGLVSSSYAGLTCPEWPTCVDGVWFPPFEGARAYHLLHRLGAYALLVLLLATAVAARRQPGRLARLCALAAALGLAQAAVGVANVLLRLPVEVTGLHSLLAALLVLTCALATFHVWQRPAPPAVA